MTYPWNPSHCPKWSRTKTCSVSRLRYFNLGEASARGGFCLPKASRAASSGSSSLQLSFSAMDSALSESDDKKGMLTRYVYLLSRISARFDQVFGD